MKLGPRRNYHGRAALSRYANQSARPVWLLCRRPNFMSTYHSVLNVKALVGIGAFNREKVLCKTSRNLRKPLFQALLQTPNMEPGCQLVFLSHYWYSETMSNTVLAACIKSTVHVCLSFNIGDNGWIHLILIFETTDRWSWIIEWPRRRQRRQSGCRTESQGELCQCQ